MTMAPVRSAESALPDGCRVTSAVHGDIPAFHVFGELDHQAAAHVGGVLARAIRERSMLVDLSGVVFVDHAGLEAVIAAVDRMHDAGGRTAVAVTSRAVRAMLRARGISPLAHLASSPMEGLGWLAVARHDEARSARTGPPSGDRASTLPGFTPSFLASGVPE